MMKGIYSAYLTAADFELRLPALNCVSTYHAAIACPDCLGWISLQILDLKERVSRMRNREATMYKRGVLA